jgi:hypothetical protein
MQRWTNSLRGAALVVALAALAASVAASGPARAGQACSAHSPAHRVALVELYSSEGCDSCPPADRWLSQWRDSGMDAGVVPLALHVDYWNSLGWTDRFSQHRFTERQHSLADRGGAHVIYTPEVFVSGRELRDWAAQASFAGRIRTLNAEPAQAEVAIRLSPVTGAAGRADAPANTLGVDAQFTTHMAAQRSLDAYVAVYENELVSQVSAGENRGATLHHDRVVRQWLGPVAIVAGAARIRRDVALDDTGAAGAAGPARRFGVAAFVEDAATGDVLQVADLAACR